MIGKNKTKMSKKTRVELFEENKQLKEELKSLQKLLKMDKIPPRIIKKRDNFKCRLCLNEEDLQVHHLTPRRAGGSNSQDNLITLCSPCHNYLHHCNPMIKFGKIGLSHKNLTKLGLQHAKDNGVSLGRPKKDPSIYRKICEMSKCRVKIKTKEIFCDKHNKGE